VTALTKVISIANQKGGVGKTTCSINLGGALAERGYRVLCVDMDPQANMTVGLGVSLSDVRHSMADVLSEDRVSLDEIVRETGTPGLWVAPATLELASTEVELFTAIGREMVLRDALGGWAEQQFDVVIIDCPPTLGLLTINALVASSRVIIPVQTQYYAIKGLTALIKVINTIKLKLNHDLEVLGLLPTFYDGRTVLAREMLENLRELGDHRVFNTMIKNTVKPGDRVRHELGSCARVPRPGTGGDRAWLTSDRPSGRTSTGSSARPRRPSSLPGSFPSSSHGRRVHRFGTSRCRASCRIPLSRASHTTKSRWVTWRIQSASTACFSRSWSAPPGTNTS
jgi:chromosome partitioning protein